MNRFIVGKVLSMLVRLGALYIIAQESHNIAIGVILYSMGVDMARDAMRAERKEKEPESES